MSETELLIKKVGLKVTSARVKILTMLEYAEPRHLSAEDIYKQLLDEGETLGLATVYRVLNQFADSGLVTRHNFEGNSAIFERASNRHDHLICQRCGKIIEFNDPVIDKRLEEIALQYHLKLTTKDLTLFGICQCKDNESSDIN
ncbi:ferric iron uptake transcriptional regulator [Celerinatantimonas sp. MCCC 1A17872]|uniref:ferric iron uptake transcriptional regulator n=1 Tax=Celerinatantimonas sp. MCCC 1A17872 TaxID=3177514 RepID=UPI0038BE8E84